MEMDFRCRLLAFLWVCAELPLSLPLRLEIGLSREVPSTPAQSVTFLAKVCTPHYGGLLSLIQIENNRLFC